MGYFEKAIALMVEKEKDLEEVEKFCSNLAKVGISNVCLLSVVCE